MPREALTLRGWWAMGGGWEQEGQHWILMNCREKYRAPLRTGRLKLCCTVALYPEIQQLICFSHFWFPLLALNCWAFAASYCLRGRISALPRIYNNGTAAHAENWSVFLLEKCYWFVIFQHTIQFSKAVRLCYFFSMTCLLCPACVERFSQSQSSKWYLKKCYQDI